MKLKIRPGRRSNHFTRTVTAFLLAASPLAARADEPDKATSSAPEKLASVEGITEYKFDNGLRLLLFPDQSQAKVTVNLTVLVGSRQEGYGETGMAHLLEHMVFKGTPRHALIPKALQEHGAQFNGSTSVDRVNYFETMSASDENLEFAIDLEADRLVNSLIRKEDLDSEMTVVRNEFERGENSPGNLLYKRMAAAAYNWHNYGKPTIGNRSDIEHVPVENLRTFYKKYYQPDNVIFIVAGKFDEAKALGLVQKHFGPIPRPSRKLDTTYTEEPAQDGERSVVLRRVGEVAIAMAAYHIPAAAHDDCAALDVLGSIMETQPSGRLYKSLVESHKATGTQAGPDEAHDPSLFLVSAEVPRTNSLEDARDTMIATVEKVASSGVTEEEVSRARQEILKARELAAADTSRIAVSLSEWASQGDWRLYFLNRDRIEKVTPKAVQLAAARYLVANNRTTGLFIPSETTGQVEVPASPDVKAIFAGYKGRALIAQGEVFDPTPEAIEARAKRLTLPEGIKVTLLPKKSRGEEVRLVLNLHFGDKENLQGMDTAANLLPALMLRGTKDLPYLNFRDELDRLKATISHGGGGGGRGGGRGPQIGELSFSVQAKRDTLPQVLELLRQVLREPALPEDQFQLLKAERLSGFEQNRTEPTVLAPIALQRHFSPFPTNDARYVPTLDESVERTKATTYDQVVQLYKKYIGSQAGELSIVGDFETETNLAILKKTFAGWMAPMRYQRIEMQVPPGLVGGREDIQTPDKANAFYVAGVMFPLRDDDPEYAAMLLGNHVLGASALSSRLGDRIRQKEGLSYGVNSGVNVSSFDERAALTMAAISNPANIPRVDQAAREELSRLLTGGITSDELAKAKEGILQGRKVGRANDQALAGQLATLERRDRTFKFESQLEQQIQNLTVDHVNDALRKFIDPTRLYVVTGGDFKTPPTPAPPKL